ncbi:Uncharacterised protein [Serratia quinivorans]|nr:Uncharacterised protein [Serratia quinivorans]
MIKEKRVHLIKTISLVLIVFASILIACFAYSIFVGFEFKNYETMPLDAKGQLGDSWGMFTSIFSALAFGGVTVTLLLQANVLADNKLELKRQDDRYEKQRFEDIVFRMLAIHSDIVDGMKIKPIDFGSSPVVGRGAFRELFEVYLLVYDDKYKSLISGEKHAGNIEWFDEYLDFCVFNNKKTRSLIRNASDLKEVNVIGYSYEIFMKEYRYELGHYFRFVYNIFKFIDESIVSDDDKLKYSKIIRAQLSDYELIIIFYSCLTWRGCVSFKVLVERYCLFDNIPQDLLIEVEHMRHYNMSAFDGKAAYFI